MATPAAAMCWGTYESMQSFLCYAFDDEVDPSAAARIAARKAAEAADSVATFAGIGDDNDDPCEWEHWNPLQVPLWKHVVAGSAAGVMEHVAMYPVDTVKTTMQAAPLVAGSPALSVRGTVQQIIQENGAGALFRGCTSIGAACIPAHIGLFGTYELSKLWLLKSGNQKEHAPLKAACCGALSTLVHDSIIVPMDVVKQRLQLGCYKNAYDCIAHTFQHEGLMAFYRSLPSTIIMECPFYAILVASNESLKIVLGMEGASRTEDRTGMVWHFVSAGVSGVVASALTQPLDVVKTRLQTQEVHHHAIQPDMPASDVRYVGLRSTLSSIFQEEGFRGFYRGTVPRMVFAAPSAALCWGTYEAVKSMLMKIG
jgi:solute carrier family 25 iron transporter 28/37